MARGAVCPIARTLRQAHVLLLANILQNAAFSGLVWIMSDTDLKAETSASDAAEAPNAKRLHKGMSKAWRFIASGAGVVATIGGVIGVYQFLASPSSQAPSLRSAEDMIAPAYCAVNQSIKCSGSLIGYSHGTSAMFLLQLSLIVRQHTLNCCCCCCSHINSHNQVRGHRTGSSHSGAEEYQLWKHGVTIFNAPLPGVAAISRTGTGIHIVVGATISESTLS